MLRAHFRLNALVHALIWNGNELITLESGKLPSQRTVMVMKYE